MKATDKKTATNYSANTLPDPNNQTKTITTRYGRKLRFCLNRKGHQYGV